MTPRVFTGKPSLAGHRGMGKGIVDGHVQNTLDSFLAAVATGADWVEVDVGRTADDGLFVVHDAALAEGVFLSDATARTAVEHGAVRVTELLDALPPAVGVIFDVKSSMDDARRSAGSTTAAMLARTCSQALRGRPAVAFSFDPAALRHLREELPSLPLGLLTWLRFPIGQAVAAAAHLDVQVLAVHGGSLWPNAVNGRNDVPSVQRVVDFVHDADRELAVWCPSERRVKALAAAGVDALVVDNVPRHARAAWRLNAGRLV